MGRPSKYPVELRERAVRMVAEVRPDHDSEYQAISHVAKLLGVGSPETVRQWIRRMQVDTGARPGVTSEAQEEIKRLKREVAELRRANEMADSTGRRNTSTSEVCHGGNRSASAGRGSCGSAGDGIGRSPRCQSARRAA